MKGMDMKDEFKIIGTVFLASIIVGLVMYNLCYQLFKIAPQENATRVTTGVTVVCNIDPQSRACGDIQTATKTEYLCDNVTCWTEDKLND